MRIFIVGLFQLPHQHIVLGLEPLVLFSILIVILQLGGERCVDDLLGCGLHQPHSLLILSGEALNNLMQLIYLVG